MLRRLLPLVPAGALVGHLLGYALVSHGHAAAVPHAHLPALLLVAFPFGALALIRVAAHREAPTSTHASVLVGAQSAGYLALELAERLPIVGPGAVLADPAVLAGLAAQLLVAWALVATVRFAALEIDRFRPLPSLAPAHVTAGSGPGRSVVPVRGLRWNTHTGRAPPVHLVA